MPLRNRGPDCLGAAAHRIRRILRETLPPELVAQAKAGASHETLHDALERMVDESETLTNEEALARIVSEVEVVKEGR